MSSGQVGGSHLARLVKEHTPADEPVADQAWVWGQAFRIAINKGVYDVFFKLILGIHHVKWDVQSISKAASDAHIFWRTTAITSIWTGAPKMHHQTENVHTLFDE
jgi:hypothetical protein